MNYSKNLQKIILELRISQTEMAKILDVSRQQLNNIINGRSSFTDRQLEMMNRKFNINVNYLLTGNGPMFLTDNTAELEGNIIRVKAPRGAKVLIEYED